MKYYNFFYKLYGLQPIIKPRKDDNVKEIVFEVNDLDIVSNNYVYKDSPLYQNIVVQYIVNYMYMFFVFSLLAWPCVYTVVKAIIEKDIGYFFTSMFIYMYLFQYIFGIILYNKSYIYASYRDLDKYDKYILYCKIGALVVSISLTTLSIVFPLEDISTSVYYDTYNNLSTWGKILLVLLVSLGRFYSYSIFFTNLITFGVIFCNHSKILETFKNNLEKIMDNDNSNITVRNIIEDYTEIRSAHSASIDKMNNIFSSLTVLGIIGCYFTIMYSDSEFVGAFTYIDIVCFAIIEIIYIFIINRIKCRISNMKDFVNSYFFMRKFLEKTRVATIKGDIYDNYDLENIKNDIFDDDGGLSQGIDPKDINKKIFPKTETLLLNNDEHQKIKKKHPKISLLKLKTTPRDNIQKNNSAEYRMNTQRPPHSIPISIAKHGNGASLTKVSSDPVHKLGRHQSPNRVSKGNVLNYFRYQKRSATDRSTQLRLNSGIFGNAESSDDGENGSSSEMEIVIDGQNDNQRQLGNSFMDLKLNGDNEVNNNYSDCTGGLTGHTGHVECTNHIEYTNHTDDTSHMDNIDYKNKTNLNSKVNGTQPKVHRGESYYDNKINNINKSTLKMDKKIDVIKHMCYGNTINSGQNSGQLDWIVLHEKLSEPWEYFKVVGFEFDDVTLVQKFAVIVIGFLGLLNLNDELGITS